ncbi:MAG: hypothetical protein N2Z79_04205, partial [Candidatus Omnitrophica bacterium]|nr:hypothetical protein [Candidatus Omnitrophota bacterium]
GNYLPLRGTIKDLFTSILAEAEKVLVVEISGNLKETKYKIRPAFTDIFEGIKSLFFKESQ